MTVLCFVLSSHLIPEAKSVKYLWPRSLQKWRRSRCQNILQAHEDSDLTSFCIHLHNFTNNISHLQILMHITCKLFWHKSNTKDLLHDILNLQLLIGRDV